MEPIGLEEAIRSVRRELTNAMAAGQDEEIRFRVGTVQLDFQVAVSREAEASGKVRFWVVELGGGGKAGTSTTHTVRLKLDPLTSGGPVLVGDEAEQKPE